MRQTSDTSSFWKGSMAWKNCLTVSVEEQGFSEKLYTSD